MLKQKQDKAFLLTPRFRVGPAMGSHTQAWDIWMVLPSFHFCSVFHPFTSSTAAVLAKTESLTLLPLFSSWKCKLWGLGGFGVLVCLVGVFCCCLKKGHSGFVWHKSKELKGFLLFSNILGNTEYILAKCFLSVLKAPREAFQESYMAFTRRRPEVCPRGRSRCPSVPSPPSAAAVWRGQMAQLVQTTLQQDSTHSIVCRIFAPLAAGRDTSPLSQKSRGGHTIVEEACPEPYAEHSCTTASVAPTPVPGHIHRESEMCLQLSLLSHGGGSRSQLATSLCSGCGGGVQLYSGLLHRDFHSEY